MRDAHSWNSDGPIPKPATVAEQLTADMGEIHTTFSLITKTRVMIFRKLLLQWSDGMWALVRATMSSLLVTIIYLCTFSSSFSQYVSLVHSIQFFASIFARQASFGPKN